MADEERGSLDFGKLSQFKPRPKKPRASQKKKPEQRVIDQAATFPSREPPSKADEQTSLLIRGSAEILNRFRQTAKRDGLKLEGLLRMALEAYEQKR